MRHHLRIVYLHQYFNTPEMAGGTRSYEMARRWAAAGHDVHLITSRREGATARGGSWDTELIDGVTVHWRTVRYDNAMGFARRVVAFATFAALAGPRARRLRPDVIFATSTPLTIIIPALVARLLRRTPIVFEVRDLWPELPIAVGALRHPIAKALARALEAVAYRSAHSVVALSPGMAAGVERSGVPQSRIVIAPNACDLDRFSVATGTGDAYRAGLSWLKGRRLVVYCGTVGAINGVDYLVTVAQELERRGDATALAVVGTGGDLRRVKNLAERAGVLNRNLYFLPPVAKAEVPQLLAAADACVSLFVPLSAMEANSANKFFDALAAGRPIVINYGGWQADLVTKHGIGLALPATDIRMATKMLADFLADREGCAAAGRRARELGQAHFGRDETSDRVLQEVVKAARGQEVGYTAGSSVRRRVDAALAFAGLVILSPLIALTAAVVRFHLGRPVLFRQVRSGLNGEPFTLVKFRTMRPATSSRTPDDDRLTPTTRFLRATSLDELPTLWNVLRGEMALVGPRPLLPKYLEHYTPDQRRRLNVRPGITGLAQVSGRNALSWPERLRLDTWYVDHRSVRMDALILLRTLGMVLRRAGVSEPGHSTMTPLDEWLQGKRDD